MVCVRKAQCGHAAPGLDGAAFCGLSLPAFVASVIAIHAFLVASVQVYVLDKDAMDIVDADVSKDKEATNGVVRMFKQSLQSLHDFVGKLETGDCDTMTPHQIIVVCERMSLSLWGSAKQQSTNNKADIEFDCLSVRGSNSSFGVQTRNLDHKP